jgi:hypothetical protein
MQESFGAPSHFEFSRLSEIGTNRVIDIITPYYTLLTAGEKQLYGRVNPACRGPTWHGFDIVQIPAASVHCDLLDKQSVALCAWAHRTREGA